jgi:amino acid permease
MFSLAYGSAQFGLILTIVFIALSFVLTLLSLNVLSLLALEFKALSPSSRLTFASVSSMILPRFSWTLDATLIIYCGGAVISYLTNIGNLLAQGFYGISPWNLATFPLHNASLVIRSILLLFLVPLCFLKQLGSTKLPVIFGLLCIFYIVVMTLFFSPCTAAKADLAPLLRPISVLRMFSSFPIMIFAYVCQFSVFHIVNELKDISRSGLNRIFVSALFVCSAVYLLMLLPFLTYGTDVKQNFLQSLRKPDGSLEAPVNAAFIFAAFSLSISYVILTLPVRVSIMALAFGSEQPQGSRELRWRVTVVLCIVFATFGISAALGDNVALPIEVAGLLGGNTLGFVFPFILYLKHFGLKNNRRVLSMVVLVALVFCCLSYPICLIGIVQKRL